MKFNQQTTYHPKGSQNSWKLLKIPQVFHPFSLAWSQASERMSSTNAAVMMAWSNENLFFYANNGFVAPQITNPAIFTSKAPLKPPTCQAKHGVRFSLLWQTLWILHPFRTSQANDSNPPTPISACPKFSCKTPASPKRRRAIPTPCAGQIFLGDACLCLEQRQNGDKKDLCQKRAASTTSSLLHTVLSGDTCFERLLRVRMVEGQWKPPVQLEFPMSTRSNIFILILRPRLVGARAVPAAIPSGKNLKEASAASDNQNQKKTSELFHILSKWSNLDIAWALCYMDSRAQQTGPSATPISQEHGQKSSSDQWSDRSKNLGDQIDLRQTLNPSRK